MTTQRIAKSNRVSLFILLVLLLFSFVPITMMLVMSLRDSLDIYGHFWSLPVRPVWSNYDSAFSALIMPMLRSIYLCALSIAAISFFACIGAYAFARLAFFGKETIFVLLTILMTLPDVLLLTPNFILADWLHIRNSLEGLSLFYIGGGQTFAIFILRAFLQSQQEEMFESARVEGAGEWKCLWKIAFPLSIPILITLAILNFLTIYNDLIWPILMLSKPSLETLAMSIQHFAPGSGATGGISRPEMGVISAGYVFSSVPLLLLFGFGMNYFVEGLTSGAIKS